MTEISAYMQGSMDASYKRLQRFLNLVDPRELLWRFCDPNAHFIIADPIEIERLQAYRTPYVGILKVSGYHDLVSRRELLKMKLL
jgi:hypothetical protein